MEANGGAVNRIALMIDADNISHKDAQLVLDEVTKYGNPTIKRVYGDVGNPHLHGWMEILNELGLKAIHQTAYTKKKNSSDIAIVIDAMDLLYDGNVEAFALVTGDSDFTSLAQRLREAGKLVYGLGRATTPASLQNACDLFIHLESLKVDGPATSPVDDPDAAPAPKINLQSALERAVNAISDDEGWVGIAALGSQLNRTHPSFDPRIFGGPGARLSTLVADQPYLETTGTGNQMRVRSKGAAGTARAAKKSVKKAARKAPRNG